MSVRWLKRSNFGTPKTGASGTRSRKPLNFESLEPRNLFATCDATIDSNWDTFGNGVAHTGYVPGSIGTQFDGKVAWSREGYRRAVIHDGLAYMIWGSTLHAMDLQTGVDLWTRVFGTEPFGVLGGGLSFDGGNLFFVGQEKDYALLYSVNANTGEINWATQVGTQGLPGFPPVVANGMVFAQGGYGGGLYGVNRNDGSLKFAVKISDSGSLSPAIYNGRLFTSAGDLFAERSLETGEALWSLKIDDGAKTSIFTNTAVVVADGIAYVVGTNGYNKVPIAIDLTTRTIRESMGDYAPLFGPAVAHGRFYLDTGSEVSQFAARSGVRYPSYAIPSAFNPSSNSQPIVTDDAVLSSSGDKTYIFDRTTRKLLLTLPVGGELSLANNTLLVHPSTGGKLFAFSLCNSQAVRLSAPLELEETAGVMEATVNIGTKLPTNLQVQLSSSNPALLKLPGSVVIPAGQTSITFPINVTNNLDRNGEAKIQITASAPNYLSSKLLINVKDDESAAASNVSDAWKEFNQGINRSGYYPGELGTYLPKQPTWSTTAGASALSISSDILFSGKVGLDAHTGKTLWRNESARTGVNVDGELYFLNNAASNGGTLYSLDAESGAIRWATPGAARNISVTDEWLLVATDYSIYRVNRASGIVEFPEVVSARSSTIYQNSLLVAGAAYNLNDLSLRWRHLPEQAQDIEYGDLTAANGRVAANTGQGLRVYDIETGRELWRVNGRFIGQPAMDNESLFVIQLGLVIQFDAATGKRVRTFDAGRLLRANQPIITDDAIIVTSEDRNYPSESRTYVFDRESGQVKHWFPTGGKAYLTRNFIYLADATGIRAYALKSSPALVLTVPELLREDHAPQPYSAQISIPKAQKSDLVVAFHSDLRSRFVLPDVVTIPAGQTSAEFPITVVNDAFDNIKSSGYIQATAIDFRSSVSVVSVADDERPVDGSIPGDWSMSGVDLARSGYVPGTIGTLPFPVVRWRNQSIEQGGNAVASNGQVFVRTYGPVKNGNHSPVLLAFDSTTGKLNWQLGFEQLTAISALTAADGRIYVAFVFKKELHVLSIDQKTGALQWRFNYGQAPESLVLAEIVVNDGVVLVPIRTIGLLGLAQASGERLYLSTFSSRATWSPAVVNGRVFIWDRQTFREIELKTGVEVWKKEIFIYEPWDRYSVPAVSDDTAILNNEGRLVALDLKTRTVRWTIQTMVFGHVVIAGDKVFAAEFDLIRTFDLKTGTALLEVYTHPEQGAFQYLYQMNVTDDAVIAQATSGNVFVFSRRTSELLWKFHGDSSLINLADDTLYLLSSKELVALSLRSASSYTKADVNGDNLVTPLDALMIINHLNRPTSNFGPRLDVSSDGSVTPLDALLVINLLNKISETMSGEGEISAQPQIDRDEMELESLDSFFESSFENSLAVDWTNLRHKNKLMFQP